MIRLENCKRNLVIKMNILQIKSLYPWQKTIQTYEGNITIRGGRQDGKSVAVAKRIFYMATKFPGSTSLVIAATERQENFIYKKVQDLIGKNYVGRKTLSRTEMKNGSEIIKFPVGVSGKFLEGLSSVDFLYADEAIHIGLEVWDSIIPMLAEPRKRGLGWITLLSATRGRPKGYFFESFSRKEFKKIHIKSEDCPHISKEFLAEELERLGQRFYDVIYNGEFDEMAMCLWNPDLIDEAVKIAFFSKKDIGEGYYYLGIDPARYGKSKAAFVESRLKGKDIMQLIYAEQIPKSSLRELRDKTLELQRIFHNRKIFIDDGGVGAGLLEFLEDEKILKRKIRPMNNRSRGNEFKILKEDLYSNVTKLLSSGKLEIVNDPEIIEGLKKVEFAGPPGEEKIIGTDLSEAAVRSLWGIKEKNKKPHILTF